VREQERPLFVSLLQKLERTPLQLPRLMLLQNPVQAQKRVPVR
jgi:hypothetical protein